MNIALCCSCISPRTVSFIPGRPMCSAYEVLIDFRIRPPSAKRCVMMCGCRAPQLHRALWENITDLRLAEEKRQKQQKILIAALICAAIVIVALLLTR